MQAEATRHAIIAAARKLFAQNGYAATTLDAIAAEAGVSVPTIYTSVGSKLAIVHALVEFVNEEADIEANDRIQMAARTPRELIAANVHLTRVLNERCGDIISAISSAAEIDPNAGFALQEGREFHRNGERAVARKLASMDSVRTDLSVEQIAAILSTTLSYETWRLYSTLEGWAFDEIEALLTEMLIQCLLVAD